MSCKAVLKKGNRKCSRAAKIDGFCAWHGAQSREIAPIVQTPLDMTCSVCFDTLELAEDTGLRCRHALHLDCAKQLHGARCPTCRMEITAANSKLTAKQVATIAAREVADKEERDDEAARQLEEEDEVPVVEAIVEELRLRMAANLPVVVERIEIDPKPGSMEEIALLSWILEMQMEGEDIHGPDFHRELHLRYERYSGYFLHWATREACSFLDN